MWTLDKIRDRIRYILGLSREQLTDEDLTTVIYEYWTCSLPMEFREDLFTQENYKIVTMFGVDSYPINRDFKVLTPSAFCDGRAISLFYNQSMFLSVLPEYMKAFFIKEADGEESDFSYAFEKPACHSSITVFYEVGDEMVTLSLGSNKEGTVKIIAGVLYINLVTPPPAGTKLFMKARPAHFAPPSYVYVGQGSIRVWPIPGTAHVITLEGVKPVHLNAEGDLSIRDELGNVIIYGTILELLAQRNDLQSADQYRPVYETYTRIAMGKKVVEASRSRTLPTDV